MKTAIEPAIKPAIEAAIEPASEPAIKPAIQSAIEPAIEPAIEDVNCFAEYKAMSCNAQQLYCTFIRQCLFMLLNTNTPYVLIDHMKEYSTMRIYLIAAHF